MHVFLIFSSFSYQFSRKSIPLISCENVTNPLVSDILRWGWHVQKVSVCPGGVPESSWKPHKSEDLEFLHRSCTLKKISTLKKNIKKNIKKKKILKSDFCWFFSRTFKKRKSRNFQSKSWFSYFDSRFWKISRFFPKKNIRSRKNIFFVGDEIFFRWGTAILGISKHASHDIMHFWIAWGTSSNFFFSAL